MCAIGGRAVALPILEQGEEKTQLNRAPTAYAARSSIGRLPVPRVATTRTVHTLDRPKGTALGSHKRPCTKRRGDTPRRLPEVPLAATAGTFSRTTQPQHHR